MVDTGLVPKLTGAILAGGQARRMGGINKALLPVGGTPIVDRVIATLSACCERIIVIANEPTPYLERNMFVVPDLIPGKGSLGGIYTALMVAQTDSVFVCACDMPFVNGSLIRCLVRRMETFDAAVPLDDYGLQPMHAIYARRRRDLLGKYLEDGLLKVEDFLNAINVTFFAGDDLAAVDPQGLAFMNVNHSEDLHRAEEAVEAAAIYEGGKSVGSP